MVALALGTAATAPAATPSVRATVDPAGGLAFNVAPSFLGISTEYRRLPEVIGHPYAGINRPLVGMLGNLATREQGVPLVRIGGGTADSAWWNPDDLDKPNGVEVDLTPYNVQGIRQFQQASGAKLLPGLNFAANRPAYAVDVARALLEGVGREAISAFEVGNEPDVYDTGRPFGTLPRTRAKGWNAERYAREMAPFLRALRALPGRPALAGPGLCCLWDHQARRIVKTLRPRFGLFTFHAYPLSGCADAGRKDLPTIEHLLSDRVFRLAAARFNLLRSELRGTPLRVSETNSSACGGKAGVTDTFAASLWLTDWLFLIASERFKGVNIHINGAYAPFVFGYDNRALRFQGRALPTYYAMLLFAKATADRARLLLATTLTARSSGGAKARVWATADRRGHARVVVVNRGAKAISVIVRVRDGRGTGVLERMLGPSLEAKEDVTLGGLSVPVGTVDGALEGTPQTESVMPRGETYRIALPAHSAALMTVDIPAQPLD